MFLLLALQLVILWTSASQTETRFANNITDIIKDFDLDAEKFLSDKFIDTLSRDQSIIKRNVYWEKFINKTKKT